MVPIIPTRKLCLERFLGLRIEDQILSRLRERYRRPSTRRPVAIFFKITLPLLMPYVMAALRIAYGVGWKIALVAELFGSQSGLGFILQQAQSVADATTVFATCIAIVLIFVAGERLIIGPLANRFRHS